jgi:hypothetical protein
MNTSPSGTSWSSRSVPMVLVCMLLAWAAPAAAQQIQQEEKPSGGRPWYAGVTAVAAWRPAGAQDYHYARPMLGGTTMEFIATAGAHVASWASVGGEVSFGLPLTGDLEFNHFRRFTHSVSYRETFVSAFFRAHKTMGRVKLEPLVAAGVAITSTNFTNWLEWDYDYRTQTSSSTASPDHSAGAVYLGWGPGVDVTVRCTRTLSITGSGRFYNIRRNQYINDANYAGLGNWTYMFGGGIRWTFGQGGRNARSPAVARIDGDGKQDSR